MYDYYRRQAVLPTEGGLADEAQLAAHELERRRLFTDRLGLPPTVFRDARLLEFGPDAGGNSLVFARWGASCTVAEPNAAAHGRIVDAFDRFAVHERLLDLLPFDVDEFPDRSADDRFDVVDAEGFIYTVQPPSRWLSKFARLTRPEGFAIVTFYEPAGSFFELLWKAVYARYRDLSGRAGVEAAEDVFGAKWRSIPHRRSLESWTMDVLENPFVRAANVVDPGELLASALERGFVFHASWPSYRSGFDVSWFKRPVDLKLELSRQRDFIARSRISYMLGRPHFLVRTDDSIHRAIAVLVDGVDRLIDGIDPDAAAACRAGLELIGRILCSDATQSEPDDRERSLAVIASTERLLELLEAGSAADIAAFCNTDPVFIETWGAPNHFLVLRRLGDST
jgi:SAM-dependent methyltransferase